MRVRRCAVVYLEPREQVEFDLEGLLSGGNGVRRTAEWAAHAPHLAQPVVLDEGQRDLLGTLSPEAWADATAFASGQGSVLESLLDAGLAVMEAPDGGSRAVHAQRDAQVRAGHWWAPAAMLHGAARWQGRDALAATEAAGLATADGLRRELGVPPPAVAPRGGHGPQLPLPRSEGTEFDALLLRRATCRNFDQERALPRELLARMLERVFAAHGSWQADDDTVFLKKGSPSGGSLHPTGAYLLVQRVEGVPPGLYHYHPVDHALQPLPAPGEALDALAMRLLAGQHWFADAPVLVVMATRFARCFWKYRQHPKAYRAVIMDAGHLSQTLYLAATDLGLGAFVTCAVNEIDIEQAFGLDPLEEGVVAVSGFGWRAGQMRNAEFDPVGRVW
jgi:SagB-type dehydrogenase domain